MVAAVPVGRASAYKSQRILLVAYVDHTSAEIVVVEFQADKVGFRHRVAFSVHKRGKAVFLEGAFGLILVIVAVALRIVERGVECDVIADILIEQELEMMLGEVVALVGIEGRGSIGSSIFAAWIIAASIFLHLLFRGVVPGHIGAFLASEGEQTQGSVV